jgi:hypothetical protein
MNPQKSSSPTNGASGSAAVVGVAACVACCAGPILGLATTIGLAKCGGRRHLWHRRARRGGGRRMAVMATSASASSAFSIM